METAFAPIGWQSQFILNATLAAPACSMVAGRSFCSPQQGISG
jgi:hypothetical protein